MTPWEAGHSFRDEESSAWCLAGFGQVLVSGKSMEKHGATWLVELKHAVEGKK